MAMVERVVTPTTVKAVSRSREALLGKTLAMANAADAPQMAVAPPISTPKLLPTLNKRASSKPRAIVKPTDTINASTVCQPSVTTWSIVNRKPSKATPIRNTVLDAN